MLSATTRRASTCAALARAFPAAAWTIRRQDIRGVFGAIVVTLCVADLYGPRGCSEVVVYPRGQSETWDRLGSALPVSANPRSVVAAVKAALREVERLAAPVHAAVALLDGAQR